MSRLVLSLFPGIGLLDMAFEEEGFCVVRGPDLLWGGDIRTFHPPAGRFDGVIGGPPCQTASQMGHLNRLAGIHGNLVPEFERIVRETSPTWWVMENVPKMEIPGVLGYARKQQLVRDISVGGETNRLRRFTFGVSSQGNALAAVVVADGFHLEELAIHQYGEPTVLAGHGLALGQRLAGHRERTWEENAKLQGLSDEWIATQRKETPFTSQGFKRVIGNGVPLQMGRAVAKAVKRALGLSLPAPEDRPQ